MHFLQVLYICLPVVGAQLSLAMLLEKLFMCAGRDGDSHALRCMRASGIVNKCNGRV